MVEEEELVVLLDETGLPRCCISTMVISERESCVEEGDAMVMDDDGFTICFIVEINTQFIIFVFHMMSKTSLIMSSFFPWHSSGRKISERFY